MAFNPDDKIKPIFFDNIDEVFDEKGSTMLTMRLTQWCKESEQPDKSKAKLELRKYRTTNEGERADKGFAFLTDDGPSELAHVLVKNGYGDTKKILLSLKSRDNFREVVESLNEDDEVVGDGEYFDMRSVLLDDEEDDIEDE